MHECMHMCMCMYAYVSVWMYTHIIRHNNKSLPCNAVACMHTCTHAYLKCQTYICAHMHACMYTLTLQGKLFSSYLRLVYLYNIHIDTYAYTHIHACMHAHCVAGHALLIISEAYICVYIHTYIHTYIRTYIYIYIHIHMHIHTYAYIPQC